MNVFKIILGNDITIAASNSDLANTYITVQR